MEEDLLGAFEVHSPGEIRASLSAGVSPTGPIKGKRPIDSLIEAYLRSPRFADCLQVMLDAGASIGDPLLQVVLMDDDQGLRHLLKKSGDEIQRKLSPSAPSRPAAAFRRSTFAPSSTPCAAQPSSWKRAPM